jgi:acyl-coenzyme A synthetase/AMP-(fatty) acid ligase
MRLRGNNSLFFRYKFPHLQICFSGGEALLPETLENWKAQTGLDIWEFYGQTETVPAPWRTVGWVHLAGYNRIPKTG